jgi:hypothetical protein
MDALFVKLDMRPDELVMAAELGALAVNAMRGCALVSAVAIVRFLWPQSDVYNYKFGTGMNLKP